MRVSTYLKNYYIKNFDLKITNIKLVKKELKENNTIIYKYEFKFLKNDYLTDTANVLVADYPQIKNYTRENTQNINFFVVRGIKNNKNLWDWNI